MERCPVVTSGTPATALAVYECESACKLRKKGFSSTCTGSCDVELMFMHSFLQILALQFPEPARILSGIISCTELELAFTAVTRETLDLGALSMEPYGPMGLTQMSDPTGSGALAVSR